MAAIQLVVSRDGLVRLNSAPTYFVEFFVRAGPFTEIRLRSESAERNELGLGLALELHDDRSDTALAVEP